MRRVGAAAGRMPGWRVKVTGYVTPAATYCAITGGIYAVTGNSGQTTSRASARCWAGRSATPGTTTTAVRCPLRPLPARPRGRHGRDAGCHGRRLSATTVPLKDAVASYGPAGRVAELLRTDPDPAAFASRGASAGFLVQFGEGLGLETIADDVGNVMIRKPASPGLEDGLGVILQAHMDMVPQKTPEAPTTSSPPDRRLRGRRVGDGRRHDLGADDGIGVAMAMAILQARTLSLGPIEALFTVNEEDGMDGAVGLSTIALQGNILINLDSERKGSSPSAAPGASLSASTPPTPR